METVEQQLSELNEYAREVGLESLCVVCEPTGGFERKLVRGARQLGYQTAGVKGEYLLLRQLGEDYEVRSGFTCRRCSGTRRST